MHGVGVAEEVVQVAEGLLIRADEERRRCRRARRRVGSSCGRGEWIRMVRLAPSGEREAVELAIGSRR